MIVHNDFKEFQKVAEEIDNELYLSNLYVYRDKKDATPRNVSGKIYINDTDNEDYFGGELVHEAGHTVFDPVTAFNYITCVNKIVSELGVSTESGVKLANIASDILNGFEVRGNKVLNEYRKRSLEYMCKVREGTSDPVYGEMLGIVKRLHGCNFEVESKHFDEVKVIVESDMSREQKYVELARIFRGLMEQQEGEGGKQDKMVGFGELPVGVDRDEAERVAQQILQNSENIEEAQRMMGILGKIAECEVEELVKFKDFYEAKARAVQMFISFPTEPTQKGVKVGSMKWKPQHGVKAIDVKRTVVRYGVNVPLATTQTARVVDKFISSIESEKPCDLVVSIDCSGSTDSPRGFMNTASDFEVVMFYALVNMAKRLDQRIGLTLWSGSINYTTLPKTLDWKESEKLKGVILNKWAGGTTRIIHALKQAVMNRDKLFFIFTDGDVYDTDLIDVDNAVFFLIKPDERHHQAFLNKYGKERVVRIDDLRKIPNVALKQYVKIFRGS
jgi:hypothetical protein